MITLAIVAFIIALLAAVIANARARNRARGLHADVAVDAIGRRAVEISFLASHGSKYDPNSFNQRLVGSKGDRRRRWRRKRAGRA